MVPKQMLLTSTPCFPKRLYSIATFLPLLLESRLQVNSFTQICPSRWRILAFGLSLDLRKAG
jgi:hypothetical protein